MTSCGNASRLWACRASRDRPLELRQYRQALGTWLRWWWTCLPVAWSTWDSGLLRLSSLEGTFQIYLDGEMHLNVRDPGGLLADGRFSIDPREGLMLFSAAKRGGALGAAEWRAGGHLRSMRLDSSVLSQFEVWNHQLPRLGGPVRALRCRGRASGSAAARRGTRRTPGSAGAAATRARAAASGRRGMRTPGWRGSPSSRRTPSESWCWTARSTSCWWPAPLGAWPQEDILLRRA